MLLGPSTYNWPFCNPNICIVYWTNSSDLMAHFAGPGIRTSSRNIMGINTTARRSMEFLQEYELYEYTELLSS